MEKVTQDKSTHKFLITRKVWTQNCLSVEVTLGFCTSKHLCKLFCKALFRKLLHDLENDCIFNLVVSCRWTFDLLF